MHFSSDQSLMKNNYFFNTLFYNFLSFFNKNHLTFVCNSYSEKESLKIRKVTSKTGNFI